MPTIEVRMPDEVNEGTEAAVGRWLKQPGESVNEHEPLIEISTDKVTVEIPSPATGKVLSHALSAGDQVKPGDLLGQLETDVDLKSTPSMLRTGIQPAVAAGPVDESVLSDESVTYAGTYSPIVRRLLNELQLDPAQIRKTSIGQRLTAADIAAHLRSGGGDQAQTLVAPKAAKPPITPGRIVPHTPMRKAIASHMAHSLQTAPHVTAVFEADLTAVLADRERRRLAGSVEAPSVTAYLLHSAIEAIRVVPEVNSRWHESHLEVFEEVQLGVGTALDTGGLVVPIIRNAQLMTLEELSFGLRTMTEKAREGRLVSADLEGGTFTLSNHGVSGSLLATPVVIPDGQAAILGAGKMQKRVIVCETGGRELFRVRPMMYVTLTIDHRVLDGQQTNRFLTAFVSSLQDVKRSDDLLPS